MEQIPPNVFTAISRASASRVTATKSPSRSVSTRSTTVICTTRNTWSTARTPATASSSRGLGPAPHGRARHRRAITGRRDRLPARGTAGRPDQVTYQVTGYRRHALAQPHPDGAPRRCRRSDRHDQRRVVRPAVPLYRGPAIRACRGQRHRIDEPASTRG
jgi:hypothetical protein